MTISPDNKLIIAKIPFYCQLMERGKLPIYQPSFHTVTNISPFVVSRSSIHTVCNKLSEQLCHLWKRLCQTSEMVVQSAWHGCAKCLAQLCHCDGTVVPKAWHKHAKGVARACQRRGTSKAYLPRDSLSNSQTGITA